MKNKLQNNGGSCGAETTPSQFIKLGLDVHADSISVARIVDGQAPQPAQRFTPERFLIWVEKQKAQASKVFACYEAGPFGYSLYRQLTEMGITCYVVRPRNWDEYGSRVKTDTRDATQLALCLDRYVAGNTKAFTVIWVPTPEEEERRSESRHRATLVKHKKRLASQGRGDALFCGYRIKGTWWKGKLWKSIEERLPKGLLARLRSLQTLIVAVETELNAFSAQVESAQEEALPYGMGKLTAQILDREIGDWSRFSNRRQVASYTGLCPSEDSSGGRRFQGAISKHGNRRLRPVLIECIWRLMQSQPEYYVVKQWRGDLDAATTSSRRKQIAVAMARQFTVDWWRVRTSQVPATKLGFVFTRQEMLEALNNQGKAVAKNAAEEAAAQKATGALAVIKTPKRTVA